MTHNTRDMLVVKRTGGGHWYVLEERDGSVRSPDITAFACSHTCTQMDAINPVQLQAGLQSVQNCSPGLIIVEVISF